MPTKRHPFADFATGATSQQYQDNFLAQFREEEGRWVFRANQRGMPVEVTPAERDRALELYCVHSLWVQCLVMAAIALAGTGVFVAYRLSPSIIIPVGTAAAGSVIGLSVAAESDARRRATAAFRDRRPVGLAQGWLARQVMIVEKYGWGTVLTWWLILPPLLLLAFPAGERVVAESLPASIQPLALLVARFFVGSSALAVVGYTLLKVAVGIRSRHRARLASRYDEPLEAAATLRR